MWPQMFPLTDWATVAVNLCIVWLELKVVFCLMTVLFLQTLHNGLLSQDAVRVELDFVHCGSCPPSGMEKISLLLGLQRMFAFSILQSLYGPKLLWDWGGMCPSSCQTRCCPPQGSEGSICSLYPFVTCSESLQRGPCKEDVSWKCLT